jgi:hypothetical protein
MPHALEYHGDWMADDLRLKVYLLASGKKVRSEVVEAARELVSAVRDSSHHGAGWVTIHDAVSVVYVFANWWVDDNVIRRRGWVAVGDSPGQLTLIADEITACVWETPIAFFESQLWKETMLTGFPNLDKYLAHHRQDAFV